VVSDFGIVGSKIDRKSIYFQIRFIFEQNNLLILLDVDVLFLVEKYHLQGLIPELVDVQDYD
jgi:hypothetical protein